MMMFGVLERPKGRAILWWQADPFPLFYPWYFGKVAWHWHRKRNRRLCSTSSVLYQ